MMKPKSIIVIIFSSLLISAVILLTILALSVYVGWKDKEAVVLHRERMAMLNAKFYGPFIAIEGLKAEYGKKDIKDKFVLEGIVKNTGLRTVTSLKIEVGFLNRNKDIIYVERFYPLKVSLPPLTKTIAALSLFTSGKERVLLPNEGVRFTQVLTEQKDKDIISPIKYKRYATNANEWSGEFKTDITRIKF